MGESRQWDRDYERERERGWECVFIYKRDSVRDGRECESLRESRRWQRELIQDGGEKERVGDGRVKVERERDSRRSKREWEREREGGW